MSLRSLLFLFLISSTNVRGNDISWNYDSASYDKNGQVQLKDGAGNSWTMDNSEGYRGLSSSASPTVLNYVVKSAATAKYCLDVSDKNDSVIYDTIGALLITVNCEQKFSLNSKYNYSRVYHGGSGIFTYTYPNVKGIYNLNGDFGSSAASLIMGYELEPPLFVSVKVYLKVITAEGEVIYEDNRRYSNDGNTLGSYRAYIVRYDKSINISGDMIAQWRLFFSYYENDINIDSENVKLAIMRIGGTFYGIEIERDIFSINTIN